MVTLTKILKEKIMKKKILLPFLCIATMPVMAQHITGKIINEQGEALPYVNVFLLNRVSSSMFQY